MERLRGIVRTRPSMLAWASRRLRGPLAGTSRDVDRACRVRSPKQHGINVGRDTRGEAITHRKEFRITALVYSIGPTGGASIS